ncbi:MAG: gfo/Idh/MocA family oxidoreductase, partial [Fuerstiella sp.]|nr:gfo/Idh/MocA family oxidoreductase [Fuerstiella sp.]
TGPLAESVLLANAAFRSGAGFDWNAKAFEATGNDKIEQFLVPDFRAGWEVDEV